MGCPKLVLPWRGSTLIEHVLAAWRASRVERTVIVVRPDDSKLAEICRAAGVEMVVPAQPPSQMKVSVALGLAHIAEQRAPAHDDVWLLAPADMPRLSPAIVNQLLD